LWADDNSRLGSEAGIRTDFTIWERFGTGALWPGGVLSRIRTRYVVGASVVRGWRVTVEEMDKNDEELRESIVQLWPIQGPKMNTILVPPKDGTSLLCCLLLPSVNSALSRTCVVSPIT